MDTITQDRTEHERAHAELIEAQEVAQNNYALLVQARAENARLREALEGIAPMFDNDSPLLDVYAAEIHAARAALATIK